MIARLAGPRAALPGQHRTACMERTAAARQPAQGNTASGQPEPELTGRISPGSRLSGRHRTDPIGRSSNRRMRSVRPSIVWSAACRKIASSPAGMVLHRRHHHGFGRSGASQAQRSKRPDGAADSGHEAAPARRVIRPAARVEVHSLHQVIDRAMPSARSRPLRLTPGKCDQFGQHPHLLLGLGVARRTCANSESRTASGASRFSMRRCTWSKRGSDASPGLPST